MRKQLLAAVVVVLGLVGCYEDVSVPSDGGAAGAAAASEALSFRLACTSSTETQRALGEVVEMFGGSTGECWRVELGGNIFAWQCGQPPLYWRNRDDTVSTFDLFYTQVTPQGPTISTGPDAYAVVQYSRCGDGRGQSGARYPLLSSCYDEGYVICRCSDTAIQRAYGCEFVSF